MLSDLLAEEPSKGWIEDMCDALRFFSVGFVLFLCAFVFLRGGSPFAA
jgi:hypothetical protein